VMDGIGSFTSSTPRLFSLSALDFTGSSLGRAGVPPGKWAFQCLLGLCSWLVYYYCSTSIVIGRSIKTSKVELLTCDFVF